MHAGAILGDFFAGFRGGQFGRGAVFVGGADEQDLVTTLALVAGV